MKFYLAVLTSAALIVASAMMLAPAAHADWRKNAMTTGDYRKDAQSDFKDLRTKRPNEPLPTTAGKLPGGVKIENGPGNVIRVDMYPGYVAKIELAHAFKDVVIGNSELIDVLPVGNRDLIIQAKAGGSPNSAPSTVGSGNSGNASGMTGGSLATGSMTNVLVLGGEGEEVANVMVNTMPSWQRYDEGKVEIYNGGGRKGSTGNGNLGSGGGLAAYVNYQCAPQCRRVPGPAENASSGAAPGGGNNTTINNNSKY
jgi:hypothetical protein